MKAILTFAVFVILTNARADLTNGLLAYYPFNGNANDESGNGQNGTVFGATLTTDRFGKDASAYSFNGSDNYINLGNPPAFNFNSNFTLSAWALLTQTQANTYILGKYFYPQTNAYGLGTEANSGLYAFIQNKTLPPAAAEIRVAKSLADGKWHHLVAVFDRQAAIRGYVDGQQVAITNSITNHTATLTNSFPLLIGKISSGQYFKGGIDDVRIYDRALAVADVRELYTLERPLVLSIETAAVRIGWFAKSNVNYQLQYSTNFQDWFNLSALTGLGTDTNIVDWTDGPQRFYRLLLP
jgi:hypothetical protein